MKRIILKISGESLAGKTETGIDSVKAQAICSQIVQLHQLGYEIGIITGGGNFWRGRDAQKNHIDRVDADHLGMLGTIMNSIVLMNIIKSQGIDAITFSALPVESMVPTYNSHLVLQALTSGKIVFLAGGTGKPYFSTDTAAAMRAVDIDAEMIFMAKNGVDGVYSDDPNINPQAIRYDQMSYDEIISHQLAVMDLDAARICQEHHIPILVFDINLNNNIIIAVSNFQVGTLITN